MKQKYAVVILLALICASGLTSFRSYQATERIVAEDMAYALTKALAEQQSDVISSDTIRVFNSYLKLEQLRGNAVLAVTTRQERLQAGDHQSGTRLRCEARCSVATIFLLSDHTMDNGDTMGSLLLLAISQTGAAHDIWRFGLF